MRQAPWPLPHLLDRLECASRDAETITPELVFQAHDAYVWSCGNEGLADRIRHLLALLRPRWSNPTHNQLTTYLLDLEYIEASLAPDVDGRFGEHVNDQTAARLQDVRAALRHYRKFISAQAAA